jgi:tyrosyl-tRNA synthetase
MNKYANRNIIADLKKRGFIESTSSEELETIFSQPVRVYIGFDPTADSLHLGNLVAIVALRWFQLYGHTPYVLMGGATGCIGDPSGKSKERNLLDPKTIAYNISKIEELFSRFLKREGENGFKLVNNLDWFGNMTMINFLRDIGKHFRLGPMLSKESVKQRMQSEEGISFTEFSYQILQGFDFYHLFTNENVKVQMGGSDQWGNITAGIELTRKLTGESVHAITFPLLTRSDGKKFGKSEDGAIFLHKEKCSYYDFYQYFMKIPDADCIKLLKMLTFLDLEEINQLEEKATTNALEPNHLQKILAKEMTLFVHGQEGLSVALKVTEAAAFGKEMTLDYETLIEISKDFPKKELNLNDLLHQKFTEVAVKSGLCPSKSEATRLIKNQGAYLNNHRIEQIDYSIKEEDLIGGKFLLLGSGKKTKLLVEVKSQ